MAIIVEGGLTPEDIAVELGRPAPAADSVEWRQWSNWIEDAKFLVRARLGDLAVLDQEALSYVVRQAVAAHVRNPDSATQVDFRVDDAATSRRYSSSSGRVSISDELWVLLDPDLANTSSVGSTQMFGEPDTPPVESWV